MHRGAGARRNEEIVRYVTERCDGCIEYNSRMGRVRPWDRKKAGNDPPECRSECVRIRGGGDAARTRATESGGSMEGGSDPARSMESSAEGSDSEPPSPWNAGEGGDAEGTPQTQPTAGGADAEGGEGARTSAARAEQRPRVGRMRDAAGPGADDATAEELYMPEALVAEARWAAAAEVECAGGMVEGEQLRRGLERRMQLEEGDLEGCGGAVERIAREVYARWQMAEDAERAEQGLRNDRRRAIEAALREVTLAGDRVAPPEGGQGSREGGEGGGGGGVGGGGPTQEDVRRAVTEVMAEAGEEGGQRDGGRCLGSVRYVAQQIWHRSGAKEGVHYQREWLRKEVEFRAAMAEHQGRKREAARKGGAGGDTAPGGGGHSEGEQGEKDGEVWWPGDAVRVKREKIERSWRWMLGDIGTIQRKGGGGRWKIQVEGKAGQTTVEVEARDVEMERRREFTERDHAVARRTVGAEGEAMEPREREGVRLVRRVATGAEEGGVAALGGTWLAECADGALVYVEAAHLRRLPMGQAGTGGTSAGFGTRAGNGQRGSKEALVAAAQEAYKACGDWRKGPMVAAMRSSGREAGRVSEREMAEAVKEAHRRWRGGPPTLRN